MATPSSTLHRGSTRAKGAEKHDGRAWPPTFFATASAADTQCPRLHKLLVPWSGLAGSSRDPFTRGISAQESYKRRARNLADNPAAAAYFWERKAQIFQDKFLPLLGVTSWWERTEYQQRGSAHGHALWWHPFAPSDGFIDVIGSFAVGVVTKEAQASDVALDPVQAARIANMITSASSEAFVYQGDVPLFVVDRSAKPAACFKRFFSSDFLPEFEANQEETNSILAAARDAWDAARWYDSFWMQGTGATMMLLSRLWKGFSLERTIPARAIRKKLDVWSTSTRAPQTQHFMEVLSMRIRLSVRIMMSSAARLGGTQLAAPIACEGTRSQKRTTVDLRRALRYAAGTTVFVEDLVTKVQKLTRPRKLHDRTSIASLPQPTTAPSSSERSSTCPRLTRT